MPPSNPPRDLTRRKYSFNPTKNEVIPPANLPNLKKYKYSGADYSILSRYLQPYWNFVVSLVPMTVAPNMITFTGFLIGISSTLLLLYFYLFQDAVYPAWAWYYAAFSLFSYQTLDAIDGKQARRTGAGSPLGELFDHGCDALLTPFVQVNVCLATGMPPWMAFCYHFQSSCGLFAAIWEQYSTGTLDLGYISGPTEGILLATFLFILTGARSTEVWSTQVFAPRHLPVPSFLSAPLTSKRVMVEFGTVRSCLFAFFTASWLVTVSTNLFHVVAGQCVLKSRFLPFIVAFPTFVLALLHAALFFEFRPVHDHYPFSFELSFGLLVSFSVTRLTIARLSSTRYNPFSLVYVLHLLLSVAALSTRFMSLTSAQKSLVDRSLGVSMVSLVFIGVWQYIFMIISVFTQIARFLQINIMTITPRKQE